MSELKLRRPIESDAWKAFFSGKGIDANPHHIGTEAHTAWEQAYLQVSIHQIVGRPQGIPSPAAHLVNQ